MALRYRNDQMMDATLKIPSFELIKQAYGGVASLGILACIYFIILFICGNCTSPKESEGKNRITSPFCDRRHFAQRLLGHCR